MWFSWLRFENATVEIRHKSKLQILLHHASPWSHVSLLGSLSAMLPETKIINHIYIQLMVYSTHWCTQSKYSGVGIVQEHFIHDQFGDGGSYWFTNARCRTHHGTAVERVLGALRLAVPGSHRWVGRTRWNAPAKYIYIYNIITIIIVMTIINYQHYYYQLLKLLLLLLLVVVVVIIVLLLLLLL
jgi:hypothetical protein